MTTTTFYHSPDLPWTVSVEDQQRFRRIIRTVAALTLAASVIFPFLPVPETLKDEVPPIPPRYARMLLEHKPPPKPVAKPVPVKKIKPKVEPPKTKKKRPEPEVKKPTVTPKAKASARETASHSGLLAFSSELASLRSKNDIPRARKPLTKSVDVAAPKPKRAVLTQRARQSSKGIDTAKLSRDTGARQSVASHQTAQIQSKLASIEKTSRTGNHQQNGLPTRSDAAIQLVFDRYKGKLYSLYNRALRSNAGLRGKVVLQLTIGPDGKVITCQIVSSELKDPKLEKRLVTRIKMFDFGAKEVIATQVTYPIDFFPG